MAAPRPSGVGCGAPPEGVGLPSRVRPRARHTDRGPEGDAVDEVRTGRTCRPQVVGASGVGEPLDRQDEDAACAVARAQRAYRAAVGERMPRRGGDRPSTFERRSNHVMASRCLHASDLEDRGRDASTALVEGPHQHAGTDIREGDRSDGRVYPLHGGQADRADRRPGRDPLDDHDLSGRQDAGVDPGALLRSGCTLDEDVEPIDVSDRPEL